MSPNDWARPRSTLLGRAWSALGRYLRGPRRDRLEVTLHEDDRFEFTTPAKGDGYDFTIDVRVDWCATDRMREEDLRDRLNERRKDVAERVENLVRPVARRFHPFAPEDAETEIARTLVTWCEDDGIVRGAVRARVAPDPAVRDVQQRIALQLQEIAGNAERTEMLIAHTSRLRDLWQTFLAECLDNWMTVHAVKLAEQPTNIALEVTRMLQERREHAEQTTSWLADRHDAFEQLDACAFLTSSDSTLRELLKMFNVPVPEIEPSSFFSRPVEPTDGSGA